MEQEEQLFVSLAKLLCIISCIDKEVITDTGGKFVSSILIANFKICEPNGFR